MCSISGRCGIGKSSVAVYVAKHVHIRRWYRHGVHFFPVGMIKEELLRSEASSAKKQVESENLGESDEEDDANQVALCKFIADVNQFLLSFPRYDFCLSSIPSCCIDTLY